MDPALGPLVDLVVDRADARRTRVTIVAIGGPVAAGKSTLAADLAGALATQGGPVAVVATDGFLYPNAELERRGLTMRKGFPESFDRARVARFLRDARGGARPLLAPTYSHRTYDVAGETDLGSPRIVILEGVNALAVEWRALVDVGVYLDAPVEALRSWFGRRLGALCRAAADAPGTFFHAYAALTDAELEAMAEAVWTSINRPNIEQHIAPTRANADVVVTKRPDHRIDRVRVAGAG